MKREIKFRGWNAKNKKWLYGYYLVDNAVHFIVNERTPWRHLIETDNILVDPDTVGQFTGLKNTNGKEIYEGDILSISELSFYSTVKWSDRAMAFCVYKDETSAPMSWFSNYSHGEIEIIGNIHDNPELLKGEEK